MAKKKRRSKIKAGRNSPCYCGSGLKYKKCCGASKAKSSPLWQLKELEKEFKKYNKSKLVSMLGGLQLCPENHSQLIRLETASRIACKYNSEDNKTIEPLNFRNIFKKYLPPIGAIGMKEDPTEGLFTNNIIFFEGNYTVYDGLSHSDSFIIQNILNTIFLFDKELPRVFVNSVFAASSCLLGLSNEIAKRNNHYRYMDSPDRWRKDIVIPDISKLQKLSNTVILSKKEIEKIITIDYDFINPFTLPIGHEAFYNEDVIKNPLIMAPFVNVDDKIVVALPGSLMGTLIHFIWVKSQQFGTTDVLLEKLVATMWAGINKNLDMMYFKPVELNLPSWEWDIGKETILKIDIDKLAYILFFTDDLRNFKIDEPYGTWDSTVYHDLVNERCEFISKWLIEDKKLCKELLIVVVIGQLGRFVSFGLKNFHQNVHSLLILADEFEVIAKTRECDCLSLWKFSKSLDIFDFPIMASFLDQYALYLEHNHSFYLSDDDKPNALLIDPNSIPLLGKSLRVKVANLWDTHAALYKENEYVEVFRLEEFIPIYYYEKTGERLVEGFNPSIWVGADDELLRKVELRPICWDIAGTISYWLWQLIPNLKSHLNQLGLHAVHITFDLDDHDKWMASNIADLKEDSENTVFEHEVKDYAFKIKIPFELTSILFKPNNKGDRLIVEELLKVFGLLLEHHSLPNLNKAERARILDIHAPRGMKKHLCIINPDNRIALNPQNLPKLRTIQEHDVEVELNDLVEKLDTKTPPIGEVKGKDAKVRLCSNIVDIYYKEIKSKLPKFNWQSILVKLIGNNEAICHARASREFYTSPSVECYSDVQSKVEKELIEALDIDRAALTTRVLIEIIASEPPMGDDEVSMSELDELLAITYHMINWAMISDQIHCEISDIDINILKSGRVGVDKKNLETIWDPFIRSKTLENVESNIENFKLHYKPEFEDQSNLNKDVENAFNAEFGLTLTDILDFNGILINMGFGQKSSVTSMQLSKIKAEIKNELQWNDKLIETAIDLFSLKSREKWEAPPSGFDCNDIWPWRYNRRLSYLRRPLVIGPESEDPIVFFGPRHIEEAERNLFNLVMSGQYIIDENTPKQMADLIGEIINKRGKEFNNKVKEWFEENTSLEIYQEVHIGPGQKLSDEFDFGDIDILVIDRKDGQIYSIECKNVFYGRNPREIRNEIKRFIGDKEEDDSWIKKHSKRHEWINNNLNKFSSVYNLESDQVRIFSILMTVREIPTTYVRDVELPFISFSRLKREGMAALYKILDIN